MLDLDPPTRGENAHAAAVLASRYVADSIDVWVGGSQDRRLGLIPIGFLEQSKSFDPPNTYMCKLIMMIGKGGKASNVPRTNMEVRGACLCVYGKTPLDSKSPQLSP